MKRSEVVKELFSAYCQREGRRVLTEKTEREIYQETRKIIKFFEAEESKIEQVNIK